MFDYNLTNLNSNKNKILLDNELLINFINHYFFYSLIFHDYFKI